MGPRALLLIVELAALCPDQNVVESVISYLMRLQAHIDEVCHCIPQLSKPSQTDMVPDCIDAVRNLNDKPLTVVSIRRPTKQCRSHLGVSAGRLAELLAVVAQHHR